MDIMTILLAIAVVLFAAAVLGVSLAKIAAPRNVQEDDGSYDG